MSVEPVGRFTKDPAAEDFLARLNEALAESHARELSDREGAAPTLHVIGAPRTGTTLLTQLIAAHLDVAYIDHLAASFWRAPLYGLRLSRGLLGEDRQIGYRSEFGRTLDIAAPHEFGYFWRDLLGYRDMTEGQVGDDDIDWALVRATLRSMTYDAAKPIVFKSFLFGLHLAAAQQAIPETCFVWVRRDRLATAMSILRFREDFAGSRDEWVSLRPASYEELRLLPRADQVVAQIDRIERSLLHQIEAVAGRNVLVVDYTRLCAEPTGVLCDVAGLLAANGSEVGLRSTPPGSFPAAGIGDPDDPDLAAVRAAIDAVGDQGRA